MPKIPRSSKVALKNSSGKSTRYASDSEDSSQRWGSLFDFAESNDLQSHSAETSSIESSQELSPKLKNHAETIKAKTRKRKLAASLKETKENEELNETREGLAQQASSQTLLQSNLQTDTNDVSKAQSKVQSTSQSKAQSKAQLNDQLKDNTDEQISRTRTFEAEPLVSKEPTVFSISDLNKAIRNSLEADFQMVWLRGEISNFKAHTSGHFYFSLKDDKAQISAVMFKGLNTKLLFRPDNGMEVLVKGKITVYEPRGTYQIFCEVMEPVGAGALQLAFEQLKKKLAAEGLFEASRKRAIPKFPKHIGIVTSPTGAAIRDMLNVLARRYKGARITILPAKVQGDQAPAEIISAIRKVALFSDMDVLIVGRGGGSIEDLWAFNNENVVRAIAACSIPTISAVGHEVDFTIADFVADLRAPTPSAAAELVAKNTAEVIERIFRFERSLKVSLYAILKASRQKLLFYSKLIVDPRRKLQDLALRNDDLVARLDRSLNNNLRLRRNNLILLRSKFVNPQDVVHKKSELQKNLHLRLMRSLQQTLLSKKNELKQAVGVLDSISPLKVVARGYSIVTTTTGDVVKSVKQVHVDEKIILQLSEGELEAKIIKILNTNPVSGGIS